MYHVFSLSVSLFLYIFLFFPSGITLFFPSHFYLWVLTLSLFFVFDLLGIRFGLALGGGSTGGVYSTGCIKENTGLSVLRFDTLRWYCCNPLCALGWCCNSVHVSAVWFPALWFPLFYFYVFFLFYFTFSYSSVSLFIYFFFLVWYSSDTSLLFIRFDISDDQTWHVADEESRNAWSSHPSSTVRLGRIHTIDINMKGWNGSQIRTRSVFTCRVERDWICVYDYWHRYFLLILL